MRHSAMLPTSGSMRYFMFSLPWYFLRKKTFGFLVATVLLGGLLVGLRDTAIVRSNTAVDRIVALSRVQNVLEEQQQSRFRIWEIGWNGFKEHPILGWGQDNFNLVF